MKKSIEVLFELIITHLKGEQLITVLHDFKELLKEAEKNCQK